MNHNFIKAALPHLVPLLLEQLTKQEEGQVRARACISALRREIGRLLSFGFCIHTTPQIWSEVKVALAGRL